MGVLSEGCFLSLEEADTYGLSGLRQRHLTCMGDL